MRRSVTKGFTLAEILVASTISAFIALVAVGALKTVSDSAQIVNQMGEATSEVDFAARLLSRDLANLYRDSEAKNMCLVGTSQGSDESPFPFLRFYMVGRASARQGQPEGDVYEVEYQLREATGSDATSEEGPPKTALFRRLWPNPDEDREPGGTLVPIAQNIDVFQIRFFDGEEWTDDWPEEMESIPKLVEVTLMTLPRDGNTPVKETFMACFSRLSTSQGSENTEGQTADGSQNASSDSENEGSR